MATKWKKWKSSAACAAFVLGVSLLITGGMGGVRELYYHNRSDSVWQTLNDSDYQESSRFREFIANRLENMLDMACGEPVYDDYYGYYYGEYEEAVADAVISAEAGTQLKEAEETAVIEQEAEEDIASAEVYGYDTSKLTAEQKKKLIQKYHETLQKDKNVLYIVSYKGKILYANLDGTGWDGEVKNMPEEYNFYLHFDGEKAAVQKDGQTLDIYGDGIYRENEDWCIPGYKNFTVKDKWKYAEVTLLAAKTPVPFLQSAEDRAVYGYGNGLYRVYLDFIENRSYLFRTAVCLAGGLAVLLLYLLLRSKKGEVNQRLAAVTAKMWFEWKVLLGLILPVILLVNMLRQENIFTYAYDMVYLSDMSYMECATELGYSLADLLPRYIEQFLLGFWLFYAFVVDLRRNKGSFRHGIGGKIAAVTASRDLKLSVAKRLTKRTYFVLGLSAALVVYLLCVFLACIILGYQMSGGWVMVWCVEGAFAIAAAILAALYFYQKKNRRFAEDLQLLAEQIDGIRDGDYEAGKEMEFEDADLRHMAEELEDIRQGLETAVEERISSERMKVELVANVSHDVKTPLTSIISYIQLLKQEEELPDYVADYIRILDEKSERLKNMVQDVFAVSKAASGQLSVELKELDLGKLLYQTLADMEEPIEKSPVTVRTEIPKEPVMVCTDGQRMYRVFQNLIGNALKYSLEGSRVYVTLKEEGALAVASVKNTSSQELDRGVDFAERFTRGDESRTDGGSGLGLSIAKSFTEACGGTFELEVIADLFVVTVTVPRVKGGM